MKGESTRRPVLSPFCCLPCLGCSPFASSLLALSYLCLLLPSLCLQSPLFCFLLSRLVSPACRKDKAALWFKCKARQGRKLRAGAGQGGTGVGSGVVGVGCLPARLI